MYNETNALVYQPVCLLLLSKTMVKISPRGIPLGLYQLISYYHIYLENMSDH